MKIIPEILFSKLRTLTSVLGTLVILQGCANVSSQEGNPVTVNGSSTVYPISKVIIEQFQSQNPDTAKIESDFSGTGGGFKKFCAKETAINAASRPISTVEMKECDRSGVRYIELPIAFDAITVVVNPQNKAINSITVGELKRIWQPEAQGKVTRWQQVRTDLPNNPLTLYGPGKDSGTYGYFTEAIVGREGASRQDYVFSEDDKVLVNGVAQDPNAMGYFGLAYYEQHQDKLKALGIDNGKGAVLPSAETVKKAEYQPLTRPLFIYVNAQMAQENPQIEKFVEYYLEKAAEVSKEVGYIPLPAEGYHLAKIHFQRGKVGTVFGGKPEFNLTIGELMRKQGEF